MNPCYGVVEMGESSQTGGVYWRQQKTLSSTQKLREKINTISDQLMGLVSSGMGLEKLITTPQSMQISGIKN